MAKSNAEEVDVSRSFQNKCACSEYQIWLIF